MFVFKDFVVLMAVLIISVLSQLSSAQITEDQTNSTTTAPEVTTIPSTPKPEEVVDCTNKTQVKAMSLSDYQKECVPSFWDWVKPEKNYTNHPRWSRNFIEGIALFAVKDPGNINRESRKSIGLLIDLTNSGDNIKISKFLPSSFWYQYWIPFTKSYEGKEGQRYKGLVRHPDVDYGLSTVGFDGGLNAKSLLTYRLHTQRSVKPCFLVMH